MATPNKIRQTIESKLELFAHGELLALTIQPHTDGKHWYGRLIAGNQNGVVVGTYSYQKGTVRVSGLVHHSHGKDHDGNITSDVAAIERELMGRALWWIPSDIFGAIRPCGMMARRVQYMADQIIKDSK